jgi:NADH-quinone oxidoreductase subunit E
MEARLMAAPITPPAAEPARFTIPDFDRRLEKVLARFPAHPGQALALLQALQDEFAYLPLEALESAAEKLGVPGARVWGVATFYNQFRFFPPARHPLKVCLGTACHLAGGRQVLEALETELKIKVGETTPDGDYSIERVACVGCCALAPVVQVEGETHPRLSAYKAEELLAARKAAGK